MIVLSTAPPGSPQWKEAHKGKIGGSGAVNILCGADPELRTFGSPMTEFMRLTGRMPEEEFDDETQKLLDWGTNSEPLHRLMLQKDIARALGVDVSVKGSPGLVQSARFPWMAVTVDGTVEITGDGLYVLETKAPSRFTAHEWEFGAPKTVMIQARAGGIVLEHEQCIGSALVSGFLCPEVKWQRFPADPSLDEWMVNELGGFMDNYVRQDTPPPPTWKPVDRKLIAELHKGKESPTVIDLPEELQPVFHRRTMAAKQQKDIKRIYDQLTNEILGAMGAHEKGRCGPYKVSYKWTHVEARMQDGYSYRNPRITDPTGSD